MASAPEFSKRMRARGKQVVDGGLRMKRVAALAIHQAVVVATPVDTGRARGNWLVALGAPAVGTVGTPGRKPRTDAPEPLGPGKATIEAALSEQPIHITNNLAYIVPLNEGHSAQAPAGFVQDAVRDAIAAIRNFKVFK